LGRSFVSVKEPKHLPSAKSVHFLNAERLLLQKQFILKAITSSYAANKSIAFILA